MATYKDFHRRSIADRDAFWRAEAELVDWQTPFASVLDYAKPPFAKWFVGGRTNLCHNAVDRHLAQRGDQKALVYISTETGEQKTYTYRELAAEVNRIAAMFRRARRGPRGSRADLHADDRRGRVRDARLRAHRRRPLGRVRRFRRGEPRDADRRREAQADGHLGRRDARRQAGAVQAPGRRGDPPRLESAAARCSSSTAGSMPAMPIVAGRDLDYATLRARHMNAQVPCEWLESSEPSYILYTSGTTGKPKGVQRDTGGYAVALASSMRRIYCVEPGDTMFTTSDIGWVVGHSYIVYAPLIAGATTILYEGLPIRPDPAIWWKIVAENKVKTMFSSPTAIRVLKKQDPAYMKRHDISTLQATCSSPASRSTSRPRAGRPIRSACRSSTTTGRPRRAGRSCPRMPGVEDTPRKFGSPSFPVYGYDVQAAARGQRRGSRAPTRRPC